MAAPAVIHGLNGHESCWPLYGDNGRPSLFIFGTAPLCPPKEMNNIKIKINCADLEQ